MFCLSKDYQDTDATQDIKANEAKSDWHTERERIEEFETRIDSTRSQVVSLKADIDEFDDGTGELSEDDRMYLIQLNQDLRAAQ
jgi:hypothetical protein